MKCCQEGCDDPATWRVFWPGKPPLGMCDPHKEKAQAITAAMGFAVHAEPLTPAQLEGKLEVQVVRFAQENVFVLARLAVAGFAVMYCNEDMERDPEIAREILATVRELRGQVPRDRAFLVLETLNDMHPETRALNQLVAEMRRYT